MVAQYNASQLLTMREVVSKDIRRILAERARFFNLVLDDVSITHLTFSKQYEVRAHSWIAPQGVWSLGERAQRIYVCVHVFQWVGRLSNHVAGHLRTHTRHARVLIGVPMRHARYA